MAEKLITLDRLDTFKSIIEGEIADARLPYKLESSLPAASESCVGYLYLIPSEDTENSDIYVEYLCVEKDGAYSWEKFGTVSITEISSETVTGSGYGSTVVTGVSTSGNKVTITTNTLTASTLGAITELKKGEASTTGNCVSDISVSGNTITLTYTTLATQSDINAAISAITGAVTSATVTAGADGDSGATSAITGLSVGVASNKLTITTTSRALKTYASSLADLGYEIATDDEIAALFE